MMLILRNFVEFLHFLFRGVNRFDVKQIAVAQKEVEESEISFLYLRLPL